MKKSVIVIISIFLLIFVILIGSFVFWKNNSRNILNKSIETKKNFNETEEEKNDIVFNTDYYESFREKCRNDEDKKYLESCCLSSVDNAEAEKSEIFEVGVLEIEKLGGCLDGYLPVMNRCITSYAWCEKKEGFAKAGDPINSPELRGKTKYADECQAGLTPLKGMYFDSITQQCEILEGNPYSWCTPCGNGVCDKYDNIEENECNCPVDCKVENIENDLSDWHDLNVSIIQDLNLELKYPNGFEMIEDNRSGLFALTKTEENDNRHYIGFDTEKDYQASSILNTINDAERVRINDNLLAYKYFYAEGDKYSNVVLIQLGKDVLKINYDFTGDKDDKEIFVQDTFNKILDTIEFIPACADCVMRH